MNPQVKIYEIKSNQTTRDNFRTLWNRGENAFYWNESNFKKNREGDVIFVVNRHDNWALYCTIETLGIPTEYHASEELTTFNHRYNTYRVKGEWESFLRMHVEQTVKIPGDWNWARQLGQSETYILWEGEKTNTPEKRREKVEDLKKLFSAGAAIAILEETAQKLFHLTGEDQTLPYAEDIARAIASSEVQKRIKANQFFFAKARGHYEKLVNFAADKAFYASALDTLKDREPGGFATFLESLEDGPEKNLFLLLGKFISHVDYHAANKNSWNETEDKRIVAKAAVRQFKWVESLLEFKVAENDPNAVRSTSVRNSLLYLAQPGEGSNILSERYRELISEHLFKSPYRPEHFVRKLIDFFEPYEVPFENQENYTTIISTILYQPAVKRHWLLSTRDKSEIQGLIVSDPNPWKEDIIDALKTDQYNYAIVWWNKSPSGGKEVIKALSKKIKNNDPFDLYVAEKGDIKYRCNVVDFAVDAASYKKNDWNGLNADVYDWKEDFNEYGVAEGRTVRIVFLVNEMEMIEEELTVDDLEYYNGQKPPVQNNLQVFVGFKDTETAMATELSAKQIIDQVEKYIAGKGFYFPYSDISNFYLSLKTKPFVILAGISGTGKTQLARLFIEAIGYESNCEVIPVRPDWTDNSDLIGFIDLKEKFQAKPMIQLVQRAHELPNEPFFLVLDEMNLARVEYYFSDFLSVIESRKWNPSKDRIITDPLVKQSFLEAAANKAVFSDLHIPDNLYIIGTVNMDETTHPFSRKVLDRANSIEMNQVDLQWPEGQAEEGMVLEGIYNDFLRSPYINSRDISAGEKKSLSVFVEELMQINRILEAADLQFAYRVRDEMAFFLLLNMQYGLLSETEAMDFQLMQKVLPRIQGSSIGVKQVLLGLLKQLEGIHISEQDYSPENLQEKLPKDGKVKYPRSLRKIRFMLRRYYNDGFTSFWQ